MSSTDAVRGAGRSYDAVDFDYAGFFRRLESEAPETRALIFYRLEVRWCWYCGREQDDCILNVCDGGLAEATLMQAADLARSESPFSEQQAEP